MADQENQTPETVPTTTEADSTAQNGGASASQEAQGEGANTNTVPGSGASTSGGGKGLTSMIRDAWNGPRRPVLILAGILLVIIVVWLFTSLGGGHKAPAPTDQAPAVPTRAGLPGGQETQPYQKIAKQQEDQSALQAENSGQSYIPPMGPLKRIHPNQAPAPQQTQAPAPQPMQQTGYAPYPNQTALGREMRGLIKGMVPVAAETANVNTKIAGQFPKAQSASGVASTASTASARVPAVVLAQPGHISFAVLDTSIKSTEPGPVMATIEDGRFAGAKLLGGYVRHAGRVVVEFNEMTLHHQSYPIQAVAITSDTARTALSTYTNYHTLYRYGWLIGASLLEGVTNALQYANTTSYLSGSGVGVVTQQLSNGQIAASAIGNVGTVLAPIMEKRFNTPPTVHVAAGTGVGILFMKPVEEKSLG